MSGYPGGMNSDHTTLSGHASELASCGAAASASAGSSASSTSTAVSAAALAGLWEAARVAGAEVSPQARFADYTTSQLGAPARGMVTCSNAAQVSAVLRCVGMCHYLWWAGDRILWWVTSPPGCSAMSW